MKKINELDLSKKEVELLEFFEKLHSESLTNIKDIQQQILEATKELERRRNLGENI